MANRPCRVRRIGTVLSATTTDRQRTTLTTRVSLLLLDNKWTASWLGVTDRNAQLLQLDATLDRIQLSFDR